MLIGTSHTSCFDHRKHYEDFNHKERPARLHLREFIQNKADGYYYTYPYQNEKFKTVFKDFRNNAQIHDLDRIIFERIDVHNITCIRISSENYVAWKNANEKAKHKPCRFTDRVFHFDEVNNVYYTLPLPAEAGNQTLASIKRGLKNCNKLCSLKIIDGQSRIEIPVEAYESIPRTTSTSEQNTEIKPQNQLRVTEREFIWDESSECYYVAPFAGEKIKALSVVLKESARRKHLDPDIFQLITKDNRKYYRITKNNYDEWVKRQDGQLDVKSITAVKRRIVSVNGDYQFKLKKGEFAYSVHKTFCKYLRSKKLNHIAKEITLNTGSNTINVTSQGKKEWDNYLSSLNGKNFVRKKKNSVKQPKTVSTAKKPRMNKLGSHYQRHFIESETYFYTLARAGENINYVLHNLNIHSQKKLNRDIFKLKDRKIIVKKDDYAEWKSCKKRIATKSNSSGSASTWKPRSILKAHKFIATKYLEDARSISIPESGNEHSPCEATTLTFMPVQSVLTEKPSALKQKLIEFKSGGFHFKAKIGFHSGEFKLNHVDHHLLFVRAGRKLNANIPCFENSEHHCTIMLIMSQQEFIEACEEHPKFYLHLPKNVQLLIINKCSTSKKTRISEAELRTSNMKRKVALLLANHFSIDDYILMDDNIEDFSVSQKIISEITPDNFFAIYRNSRELREYQDKLKPVCITTGTFAPHKNIPNPLSADGLQPLSPSFGSKIMYVHSKDIICVARTQNIPLVDLCSFRDLNWGEDYYWQCALGIVTCDDRTFLGRLPFQVAYLQRSDCNRNATLALPQFKLANEWLQTCNEIKDDPTVSQFQKTVALEMKKIVELELERRKLQEAVLEQTETAANNCHKSVQELMLNRLQTAITAIETETDENTHDELMESTSIEVMTSLAQEKIKRKGADIGKCIAQTGFDLNLQKLNKSAEAVTSTSIEKEIFINAAKEAHEKIYGALSEYERAVIRGKYHGEICVNQYRSKVIKSDLINMANNQGAYKQTYLDSFYTTIQQVGASEIRFVEDGSPKTTIR